MTSVVSQHCSRKQLPPLRGRTGALPLCLLRCRPRQPPSSWVEARSVPRAGTRHPAGALPLCLLRCRPRQPPPSWVEARSVPQPGTRHLPASWVLVKAPPQGWEGDSKKVLTMIRDRLPRALTTAGSWKGEPGKPFAPVHYNLLRLPALRLSLGLTPARSCISSTS